MFGKNPNKPDLSEKGFFVHLGVHKTATTALQNFLFKNLKQLLAHDVRYIPLKPTRSEITPLVCSAEKTSRKRLIELLASFPNRKILFSDENLLGNLGDIPYGTLYPYARSRILRFCDDVAPARVELFLTLREPSRFVSSMYSEYIRHNPYLSFDEYIRDFDLTGFSYLTTFSWLSELPPNASARWSSPSKAG